MTVERNVLVSLLKLTQNGIALIEDVKNDTKLSGAVLKSLLGKLQSDDMLNLSRDFVKLETEDRLKLAVKAVSLGADIEAVSSHLDWQEFESIAAAALRHNGYVVYQNLRFKHLGRKWEIDVVGCRKPLVACVDCKDWHRGAAPSVMRRIVEAQANRVNALADVLPHASLKLECTKWSIARFVPIVMVLMQGSFPFSESVPVVPVLKLQDFLHQLPLEVDSLRSFQKEFVHL